MTKTFKKIIHYDWKILLVEHDLLVQQRFLKDLENFVFDSRNLKTLVAGDISEAKKILAVHPDIDVVFLGSLKVLEEDALNLIQHVRKKLNNAQMRLVLLENGVSLSQSSVDLYDLRFFSKTEKLTCVNFAGLVLLVLNELKFLKRLARLNHKMKTKLDAAARFVPKQFLKLLNKDSISQIKLGDCTEQEMTVLFLDIRSFSEISVFLSPLETFELVNHCIHYLEPLIIKHNGFIDKYIGDALMALFPGKADDAVMAGIEMQEVLQDYNNKRMQEYQIPIQVGIGVNTGLLAMGVVGTPNRMDCTVMSDAVNMAARLEKLNKLLESQLLFSDQTFHRLKQQEHAFFRYVGRFQLSGRKGIFGVYEAFDANVEPLRSLKQKTLEEFNRAVQCFHAHRFEEAQVLFRKINQINAQDGAVKYFLEKLRYWQKYLE